MGHFIGECLNSQATGSFEGMLRWTVYTDKIVAGDRGQWIWHTLVLKLK